MPKESQWLPFTQTVSQQGADNHQKLDALNEIAENQFHYLNLYTVGLIKLNGRVVSSEEDLLEEIKQRL